MSVRSWFATKYRISKDHPHYIVEKKFWYDSHWYSQEVEGHFFHSTKEEAEECLMRYLKPKVIYIKKGNSVEKIIPVHA
jgi:hypothetical protein